MAVGWIRHQHPTDLSASYTPSLFIEPGNPSDRGQGCNTATQSHGNCPVFLFKYLTRILIERRFGSVSESGTRGYVCYSLLAMLKTAILETASTSLKEKDEDLYRERVK